MTAAAAATTPNIPPAANPSAAPAADATTPTQSANLPWYGEIPAERADLREWATNKAYKDPLAALESSFNLEKLLGFDKAGRTAVLPKDDKDVEGLKAFRTKLGIPETPEGYELPLPELKEGEQHTEAQKKFNGAAAQWLHAAGVPKTAAHGMLKSFNDFFAAEIAVQQQAEQAASSQALEKVKTEWGADFDKNAEFARRFLKDTGADDAWLAKYEATFGTADMLSRFFKWGSATAEHPFKGGPGGNIGLTLDGAKTKIEEIRAARAAGTITDVQWRDGKQAEYEALAAFIGDKTAAQK